MPRLALTALLLTAGPAAAGVVAVSNISDRPVTFAVRHATGPAATYTLAAGEARLVPAGRQPDLSYTAAGKAARFRLEPFQAYLFSGDAKGIEFHGVDLAGAMPKPDDVPEQPPALPPLTLPVVVMADDASPLQRAAWEKAYRARIAAASEVLVKQCNVALTVVGAAEWRSDPAAGDLTGQMGPFEKAAPSTPGTLAIGFLSRRPKLPPDQKPDPATGFARKPLWPYLLVREGNLRTEPERTEAIFREVGHYLGAAHSPDPLSAMRSSGPGAAGRYPVGLDPLNLLAVGVWASEVRAGAKSLADLKPVSKERLTVIYKSVANYLPADPLASDYLATLERGEVAQRPVDPPPAKVEPPKIEMKPADPPPVAAEAPKLDRTAAVRKVVRAVRLRAQDIKADPRAAAKYQGDALTVELMMAAADIAYPLADDLKAPAFLLGIGIALDDSSLLRNNLLTGDLVKAVETDAERAERLAALGTPTLRGRRDLCQHFVVSAALTAVVGPKTAESLGLLKEMSDKEGVSGFSFADLAADIAGVTLAVSLAKYPPAVGRFRDGVNLDDYMPPLTGLREGLTAARFAELYGDTPDDPRFVAEREAVRRRVTELPKYKEIAELKGK